MTSILDRSLGLIGSWQFTQYQIEWRIRGLRVAPWLNFSGSIDEAKLKDELALNEFPTTPTVAHSTGVNCITIDGEQGRLMLTGGADASVSLWDLNQSSGAQGKKIYQPLSTVSKSPDGHQYGISQLSFYPVDPGAFITSSYDKTVQVWDTNTLQSVYSFSVPGKVYSHDLTPKASRVLAAAAAQDSFVRIIDLEGGSSTHALPGHKGAVLSVAWSPVRDYILASAGSDGTVRLWDIRSPGNNLGMLDYEDTEGIVATGAATRDGASERQRSDAKAHMGPANGVCFSQDGTMLVSCGHDERVRVWDAASGANTLVHFGPTIRNRVLAALKPAFVPTEFARSSHQFILYPNGAEMLLLDILDGSLLLRLRPIPGVAARVRGERALRQRVTGVTWRPGHCEAYSSHSSGLIKAWIPQIGTEDGYWGIPTESEVTREERHEHSNGDEDDVRTARKRRREDLQQVYRDLTKQKITFT